MDNMHLPLATPPSASQLAAPPLAAKCDLILRLPLNTLYIFIYKYMCIYIHIYVRIHAPGPLRIKRSSRISTLVRRKSLLTVAIEGCWLEWQFVSHWHCHTTSHCSKHNEGIVCAYKPILPMYTCTCIYIYMYVNVFGQPGK